MKEFTLLGFFGAQNMNIITKTKGFPPEHCTEAMIDIFHLMSYVNADLAYDLIKARN